jgi:hypothetical protein
VTGRFLPAELMHFSRRRVSDLILMVSVPVYAGLCWRAIQRRGFPEIDPFWLGMRFLWIVPILLSGAFDAPSRSRKWRIGLYTIATTFFFSGTFIWIVPHQISIQEMLLATVFPWGPLNLLIALGVEKAIQLVFRALNLWPNSNIADEPTSIRLRAVFVILVVLGMAVAFPFAYRASAFQVGRSNALANAERDWASGQAIWYVRRGEPESFGASPGCYSVETGLRVESFSPGVAAGVYCEAYRAEIARKLAQNGKTQKVKDLCTQADLQAWIRGGRFKRADSLPVKQGAAEISLKGYNVKGAVNNVASFRGEPSKFLYYAAVPEKKDALVVATDDSIWVFAKSGELIQSVDFETYRRMGITEDVLAGKK